MQRKEVSAVISLGLIMTFRMLGLFMILPIFSVAAAPLLGATPALIGLALGIYGLTQGLLQIPFGLLSDKLGRKPIIIFGLLLFAGGSLIAAYSTSIYSMILGRALQGAGAIGSTILATVSDLTTSHSRTKAMAFIGLNIGFAFILALILGPALNSLLGLSSIFILSALLAIFGIFMTLFIIPSIKIQFDPEVETEPKNFRAIVKNLELLRLDFGIFCLHATLTSAFIAIPLLLGHVLRLSSEQQVIFYTLVLLAAFFLAFPLIVFSEKKKKTKPVFLIAILGLALSLLGIYFSGNNPVYFGLLLLLFFTAFTVLEATLPSLVSKIAPVNKRGTAMGIYSSSQFLGIFIGGSSGGLILSAYGEKGVFAFAILLLLLWFLSALKMQTLKAKPL